MKKSIKRVLISVLIVLLVVLFQGQSFATTNSLTLALTRDKTELEAGETVVVLVNVSNIQGEGIIGFNANVNYDANVFECTAEGDDSGAWAKQGFIENNLTTARADLLANSENQTVAKLTFKAKSDATVGEKTISLSQIEFSTENEAYNVDDVQVKVQIITEPTPGGDDDNQDPTPDPEPGNPTPDPEPENPTPENPQPEDPNPENPEQQTPTTEKLPEKYANAGLNNFVVMAIVIAVVVTVVCFYQYKKYKNI